MPTPQRPPPPNLPLAEEGGGSVAGSGASSTPPVPQTPPASSVPAAPVPPLTSSAKGREGLTIPHQGDIPKAPVVPLNVREAQLRAGGSGLGTPSSPARSSLSSERVGGASANGPLPTGPSPEAVVSRLTARGADPRIPGAAGTAGGSDLGSSMGRPPEIPQPPKPAAPIPNLTSSSGIPEERRRIRGKRLAVVLLIVGGLIIGIAILLRVILNQTSTVQTPDTDDVIGPTAGTVVPLTQKDTDGDGLTDEEEASYGTSVTNTDTDGDSISDKQEIDEGSDPRGEGLLDQDSDALSDRDETKLGTDPRNVDTDGDGYFDGKEVQKCYDPRIPSPRDKIQEACPPYPGL